MNTDPRELRFQRFLRAVRSYIMFFLLLALVISCCIVLFLKFLQSSLALEFTEENIGRAAKATFLNVLLLTTICSTVDQVRHIYTVERPVNEIIRAARRITAGDFTARVPPVRAVDRDSGLAVIASQINTMARELGGVETLRTDFIANVSHEMKTPLAVIQNYGTLLRERDLTVEQRMEYAKGVTDASRRLANLVTNILKLNKLENQQLFPENRRFNLTERLCECLLGFENIWEEKGIEIETELEEDVMVESDPELLSLVWNNLLSNAFKFTPDGGTVALRVYTRDGDAMVSVRDTGCGMTPEVGRRVFEKFYQGDKSHATQGNGLGLALVKRVIDIVDGDISVESEAGRGSTFTVRLRGR